MTHFDLVNTTKVTLGHLINMLGVERFKVDSEDLQVSDYLIVKHAINLAKETLRQLDLEQESPDVQEIQQDSI